MTSTIILPEDDLPQWMKQARRGPDQGFWLVLSFSLLLAWPFILYSELPVTNDSEHYVYRAQETAQALQAGRWYPRWSPIMLDGLGVPLPHYEPPASSYAAGLLTFLATADAVLAVRLLYIAAYMLAGCTTYLLVKNHANGRSGVIAAVLYLYSPYVGQTVPHLVGNLPEMLALALLPTLLWSLHRLLTRNLPLDVALLAVSSALLIWTSMTHFVVALCLALAILIVNRHAEHTRQRLILILLGIECGVFLAGNYWFPLLWESDLVQWYIHPLATPQYQLIWQDLLGQHPILDPSLAVMAPQLRLGWPLLLFCGAAAALLVVRQRSLGQTLQAMFLLLGIGLTIGAIFFLPAQTSLLGIITFCLAIGGSLIMHPSVRLDVLAQRLLLTSASVILLGLSASVWFTTPQPHPSAPLPPLDYQAEGYGMLGLPLGARFPSTLTEPYMPAVTPINDGMDSLQRLNTDDTSQSYPSRFASAHTYEYVLQELATDELQFVHAYLDGWEAYLDGVRLELSQSLDNNLIVINLGEERSGTLVVRLGPTPPRLIGWGLMLAGLIAIVLVSWRRWLTREPAYDDSILLNRWDRRYLRLVLVLLVGAIVLKTNTQFLQNYEPLPGASLQQAQRLNVGVDETLTLLGWQSSHDSWRRGNRMQVTLTWRAMDTPTTDYEGYLQLSNLETGASWRISDAHVLGYYPTRRWPVMDLVQDRHTIVWPADLPPGDYTLEAVITPCAPACTQSSTGLALTESPLTRIELRTGLPIR